MYIFLLILRACLIATNNVLAIMLAVLEIEFSVSVPHIHTFDLKVFFFCIQDTVRGNKHDSRIHTLA